MYWRIGSRLRVNILNSLVTLRGLLTPEERLMGVLVLGKMLLGALAASVETHSMFSPSCAYQGFESVVTPESIADVDRTYPSVLRLLPPATEMIFPKVSFCLKV